MSNFPSGNFTITNNDTGRCLRARLGRTTDISDYKEGTKYLLGRTDPPALELGPPDGSLATAWYFDTAHDSLERQPFNQIVNVAVRDLQNIGNRCVWLYTDSYTEAADKWHAQQQFAAKMHDLPDDLRERLSQLIPEEWKAQRAQLHEELLEEWKTENEQDEENHAWLEALLEADAAAEEPLEAGKLAQFKVLLDPTRTERVTKDEEPLLKEISAWQARISDRAEELLPQVKERRAKALELEWQQKAQVETLEQWTKNCVFLAFHHAEGLKSSLFLPPTEQDKRYVAAMRVYLDEAAKEGIYPSCEASGARTDLNGCGVKRSENRAYRWQTDGTYIFGADSDTVLAERCYWTDDNGYLVGKNKNGPGQTWTIEPWTPPARIDRADVGGALLTGLFGPLASVLRHLG